MSDTVWVQCGNVGLRVPEDDGLATAAELLADPGDRDPTVAAIHDGDCLIGVGVGMKPGAGICDCEPFMVAGAGQRPS